MDMPLDFTVPSLGPRKIPSPIKLSGSANDYIANYVSDDDRILYDILVRAGHTPGCGPGDSIELAGPRERIYFDPSKTHAAVVTCGGLCPGLNDVIRSIVMCLWYHYGVRRITGIRYGYRGLLPDHGHPTVELTPALVEEIHTRGGTILGSSRGEGERTEEIVDALERLNVNVLFPIGGDGTQRGALKIAQEAKRRGMRLAVVGVPKTIDNDLAFVSRSFGFETAVARAVEPILAAHVEAHDAVNGVSIVKVMGRESGFIAAHATLAANCVNYVLVPEVPFTLDGPRGLLAHLRERLKTRTHAVILVAEGAGQGLLEAVAGTDASGNRKLADIGPFLKQRIGDFFKAEGVEIGLRYIDPSYIIRSAPASAGDSLFCARLGNNAAHAAMAGKTEVLLGLVNDHFVHLPVGLAVSRRNKIDPESALWRDVIESTGQPPLFD